MTLYRVATVKGRFDGCKNVKFHWFLDKKTEPRPYADLIADYDPKADFAGYAEDCIDEMFTLEQAEALKKYLDSTFGDAATTIEKVTLPISNNCIGFGSYAVGGGDDFYLLTRAEGYPLPFKVWGYFDLIDCELADGSGETFRMYCLLASKDANGKIQVREETQEEARQREDSVHSAKERGPGDAR
jgi:hypothetical protein